MNNKRFSTFEGVFTPTFLSILGVIMYLRLGWVVGHAGLRGALLIIIVSNVITLLTGFSIASIATNTRVGTGGAYAMISKSLGLAVGGAIGIPLYFSQALSVAFYIAGFTECWIWVFPQHDFLLTALTAWLLLFFISYMSAKLAFRLQFIIIAIIVGSLVSIFLSEHSFLHVHRVLPPSGMKSFWEVFAVFFPAVTGILAGVSMSGELKNPQRSLPAGTLIAIALGFFIYIALALWFAMSVSPAALINDSLVVLKFARWRGIVIAGIMGATVSSALSMFVSAPRTVLALSKHRVIPFSSVFFFTNKRGEPTPAILLTALISLITLSLGTLNSIAALLTMFFLITYGMLNASVVIEKATGIVSFRPTFKMPVIFSLIGALGCFWVMFLINPVFSVVAIIVIVLMYVILIKAHVSRSWPDARKGLFIFIAEWALRTARSLPYHPKIWKPNLIIPVEEPRDWVDNMDFVRDLVFPSGRVEVVTVRQPGETRVETSEDEAQGMVKAANNVSDDLAQLAGNLNDRGLFVSTYPVTAHSFLDGATIVLQTLHATALPPNVLFLKLGQSNQKDAVLQQFVSRASAFGCGIVLYNPHPVKGLGEKRVINLWIREGSPNADLAILAALQLSRNWDAHLRLVQVIDLEADYVRTYAYMKKLKRLMRLPMTTELRIMRGDFRGALKSLEGVSLHIFGMPETLDLAWVRDITIQADTATLFVRDSPHEKATV